jgi:hypothetical protein
MPVPVWQEVGPGLFAGEIALPDLGKSTRLIPSLSVLSPAPCGFRFALRENGHWRALDAVGELDLSLPEIAAALQVQAEDIDEDSNLDFFDLPPPSSSRGLSTGSISMRNRLSLFLKLSAAPVPGDFKCVLGITMIELPSKDADHAFQRWIPWTSHGMTVNNIAVSPISQMEQDKAIARRICSPITALMVVRYLSQREIPLEPFVAVAYSPPRRMYGIWPRAIMAAARQGVAGMVTALAGWDEAAALLRAGLPVIATIAYQAGELAGAAVASTGGHLVTVIGLTATTVIVNDPAASTAAEVRREYDLEEFARAWFGNKRGVCYVLWK